VTYIRQASDQFNRANNPLNTLGWSALGTYALPLISSRHVQNTAITADNEAYFGLGYWAPDQYSEVTVKSLNALSAIGATVRISPSAHTGYMLNIVGPLASATSQIYKQTGVAAYTSITGTVSFPNTLAVGDIIRLTAQGTTLSVTQNGNAVQSVSDSTYTAGFPGIRIISNNFVTDAQISNWAGGYYENAGVLLNPWLPQGIVLYSNPESIAQGSVYAKYAGNPSVIYEGSPQILAGPNVFKMWYGAFGFNYAESLDGINWTDYASNPIINSAVVTQGISEVFKVAGTYYLYLTSHTSTTAQVDCYTSSDGITWTLQLLNCLGAAQGWEAGAGGGTWQLTLAYIDSGTWYATYAGSPTFKPGLATSSDGITWTKYAGNPLSGTHGGQWYRKIGGLFYTVWPNNFTPNGGVPTGALSVSTFSNITAPWTTRALNTYYSATPGDLYGGVTYSPVDPYLVEVSGKTYMYYTITQNGTAAGVGCAIANSSVASLLPGIQGVLDAPIPNGPNTELIVGNNDNFTRANANPVGGNWNPLASSGGFGTAQIVSNLLEPSAVATDATSWYAGGWNNSQWSQVTVAACANASSIVGAAVRCNTSGTATCYRFYWTGTLGSSGTWHFQNVISGTPTDFQTGTMTVSLGDTIAIAAVGTNLYAYWNGVPVYALSDNQIASGNIGVVLNASVAVGNAQISAWAGGNANVVPSSGGGSDLGPGYDFKFRL
jgi:hypothetical protein